MLTTRAAADRSKVFDADGKKLEPGGISPYEV